ncbi:hypothetical protein F2Q70_00031145 [Brassica cretica]|uniref:Large ribosomal subunit protein eL14 domain-containing protein n=1 Tax=Brassica cretica TaxID=69181 RepID=A0A8S9FG43_BRACR|nr:hypothetical protein F2Q70_00031145 [Brassica cretica]
MNGKNAKKAMIEAPSPQKEPKSVILQLDRSACNENAVSESSFTAGEKLCEVVFVLLHQLKIFSLGRPLPEQPPIHPPADRSETSRATTAGLDLTVPKPGTEVELVDAVPCRIAFERGKERNFSFLALSSSSGVSGWIVLAEESLLKPDHGTVRVTAPLAGCNPRIDEKHPKWLHLRIRPSTLPFLDPTKRGVYEKLKSKGLVDGRWTLAFRDDDSCSSACSMVLHEIDLQCREVERRWEKSSWGRKLIVQKRRAALNEIDRFKIMLAKIQVSVHLCFTATSDPLSAILGR